MRKTDNANTIGRADGEGWALKLGDKILNAPPLYCLSDVSLEDNNLGEKEIESLYGFLDNKMGGDKWVYMERLLK